MSTAGAGWYSIFNKACRILDMFFEFQCPISSCEVSSSCCMVREVLLISMAASSGSSCTSTDDLVDCGLQAGGEVLRVRVFRGVVVGELG